MELYQKKYKDLGLKREVLESLPYAVVGGTYDGSFSSPAELFTPLNHIVPNGVQLKLLFLRVFTQEPGGARFRIYQTNPAAVGATGTVEAYPPVGSVPPFSDGAGAVRDYPFLEAAGGETLRGSLIDPIHVFEGSVDFTIMDTPTPSTGYRYGITWWGVQELME